MGSEIALTPALSRKAGEGASSEIVRNAPSPASGASGRGRGEGRRLIAVLAAFAVLLGACGPGTGSIGAMLAKQKSDGRVMVRSVPPDMESAKAGLEPGDEILSIDGRDARTMSAQEIHETLVGDVGTTVDLTVARKGSVVRVRVKRGALK